ncbi:MAG: ribosomal protein S18-alanine N-acetyltransferase [Holosporaceae bacterium]|jgi:ribosomal-protein-alanine N-acetyltransferase|nr:ribosomal protein S18-alanine N-acetyltransferase [Holosporaceae bacterium]
MIANISTDDSETLAKIHRRCFNDDWSAESFQELLSQNVFFGFIYKEEKPGGFILGKIVCHEIEIITFCVLPELQNRRIGKTLLMKIDDYAVHHFVNNIFLEVSEDNVVARKIYEDFGYKEISRRAGYYQSQNRLKTAIVLKKRLLCGDTGEFLQRTAFPINKNHRLSR